LNAERKLPKLPFRQMHLQDIFINVSDTEYSDTKVELKCVFRINLSIPGELQKKATGLCCLQTMVTSVAALFRALHNI